MSDRTGTTRRPEAYGPPDDSPSSGNHDARAEQWKSQIQAQKSAIASLQREIASLSESVHYAGGNCVANCVQWNERQKEKQDRVEVMKQQLEEQEKRMEDLQESARKQGFGSSVYEP
jgi:predicted RNase H-like nuclease (RuvC/YqgF family)